MEEKMKIEYRKLTDNESAPWLLLTNIDELIWNGVYVLRVTDDDGSSGLPFRLGDNDIVTLVLKDHAHEGTLQGSRTIVQTVTYVERSTGKVFIYTRTRCNEGKNYSWSYWALSEDSSGITEIPKASAVSLGAVIIGGGLSYDDNGKISVAYDSVGEERLSAGLRNRIKTVEDNSDRAETLIVNDGVVLSHGALVANSEPYHGTQYCAVSNKIFANGETIVLSSGYKITAYKMFDGEEEISFVRNMSESRFLLGALGCYYQFEFAKDQSTAFRKEELQKVVKSFIRNVFVWNNESNIDKFTTHGTYNIRGFRGNPADGLPIYNTGTIEARLTVFAADNCITQVLTLLNAGGGDSNIYVRTRQADKWGMWGKLQSNVEVGAIGLGQSRTFDDLTDNGIYSGANVYPVGTGENGYPITAYENFVLITINAYLTGGGISQLKYNLLPNGVTTVAVRTKHNGIWGEWDNINKIDAEINNESENPVQNKAVAKALSKAVEQGRQFALRSLFIAAGAEYNDSDDVIKRTAFWGEEVDHLPNHYYLNGLGDIDEEEMMKIYQHKDDMTMFLSAKNQGRFFQDGAFKGYRTLFGFNGGSRFVDGLNINAANPFASTNDLEVIKWINNDKWSMYASSIALNASGLFFNITKIRVIDIFTPNNNINFHNASALQYVRLHKLKYNMNFNSSKNISKGSILYMINNAVPTSAITITLHPDAYARLADDTEIVAALEAQPLISLVSA